MPLPSIRSFRQNAYGVNTPYAAARTVGSLQSQTPPVNSLLLGGIHLGFFKFGLGIGFHFIGIQLGLSREFVLFNLRFLNNGIFFRLFLSSDRSGIHCFLLLVNGCFGGGGIVINGRLLFITADEGECDEGENYRYQFFHNF